MRCEVADQRRRRLIAQTVLAGVVGAIGGLRVLGSPAVAAVAALAAAGLIFIGRPVLARHTNALSVSYLRAYLARDTTLVLVPEAAPDHAFAQWLAAHHFVHEAAVGDTSAMSAHDLYRSASATVVVALARHSGSMTVLSRLGDGRVLQSAAVISPPPAGLIMNARPRDDELTLLTSHLHLLDRAVLEGNRPVRTTAAQLWWEALQLERQGYRELGIDAAGSLDVTGRGGPWQLVGRIEPGELLERSWAVPGRLTPATASRSTADADRLVGAGR